MKKYTTPEFELLKYETEDCLTGSDVIDKEQENIGDILEDLT